MVWHRERPTTRYQGFQHMLQIANPDNGAVEHIDGFVIPEVGDIDDWKKADEFFTIVENEYGLEEGSLSMSVIVESGEAELALGDLRAEMGKPSNNLERLFLLVDGEVDYSKDMRGMTPTGELPSWPELRHNTSRGASAAGLIAVDGPFDDIRDIEGYRERMIDNRAKGMIGIWSLTPSQVVEANTEPLPPQTGSWLLTAGDTDIELEQTNGKHIYDGDSVSLSVEDDDTHHLVVGSDEHTLDRDELRSELLKMTAYVPSMDDIVVRYRFNQFDSVTIWILDERSVCARCGLWTRFSDDTVVINLFDRFINIINAKRQMIPTGTHFKCCFTCCL